MYEVTHKKSHKKYAVKSIHKEKLDPDLLNSVRKEIDLLSSIKRHRHIIRLYEVYEGESELHLVLEM